ncbi:hypothetical protein [Streptomyces sp. NPDC057287]|uniref:hypothetical protein n=1 Tax=Streptomyces sp. NPDC057287 TaxID=3346086 RepID=UPI00363D5982
MTIGYNTETQARRSIQDASDQAEARWNYAFWIQNELTVVGDLARLERGRRAGQGRLAQGEARRGADRVRSLARAVPDASAGGDRAGGFLGLARPSPDLPDADTALVTEGTTSKAEWVGIEESARTVTRAGW